MALALLVLAPFTAAPAGAEPQATTAVLDAIADAAIARLGAAAMVSVTLGTVRAHGEIDAAVPEPGARFGRPARFRLLSNTAPVGYAVATVTGLVPHLKVRGAIGAGEELQASHVDVVVADPGDVPFALLPGLDEALGARTSRRLAAGETITATALRVRPAVQSGQAVAVVVVVDGVEVQGVATALQSGRIGEVILLVNTDSRRQIRGRIVAAGRVEVVHGS